MRVMKHKCIPRDHYVLGGPGNVKMNTNKCRSDSIIETNNKVRKAQHPPRNAGRGWVNDACTIVSSHSISRLHLHI
jgi:hypothetical protein